MRDSGLTSGPQAQPRVVVVGGGFAGLSALKELAGSEAHVTLVDKRNYHTFQALLYQVAASEISPEDVAYPLRSTVRRSPNVRFVMTNVKGVDFENRVVEGDSLKLPYDYLILGTGGEPNFFGIPGADQYTLPLKSLEDSIALRSRILSSLEHAAYDTNVASRQALMTFVIIGGGPTGVELTGAMAELVNGPVAKDYKGLNLGDARVVLLEATDNLLPGFPKKLSSYVQARLKKMGVDVRLDAVVSRISEEAVTLNNGDVIPTNTAIWTAGINASPPASNADIGAARNRRVTVLPTLQMSDHPEVYVAGDLAYLEENGRPLPMLAPVAMQEGRAAAHNIKLQIRGRGPVPFRYRDTGSMVVVGRNAAIARLGRWTFTGFPAWVMWLSVHLARNISFRNRLLVLLGWADDYIMRDRAVRLILDR